MKTLLILLVISLVAGCTVSDQESRQTDVHDNMNSVLWMQTSGEHEASYRTVYRAAELQLAPLRDAGGVTGDIDQAAAYGCRAGEHCGPLAEQNLLPAVVLDIDETVLDNVIYQARLVRENREYQDATWDLWVAERKAGTVPGVIGFIEAAQRAGVAVIYLTNRSCSTRNPGGDPCPQREDTLQNMLSTGVPALGENDLFIMRNERPEWNQSEKQLRRQFLAAKYRIMMLIGDDIGDFASGIKGLSIDERLEFVQAHAGLLGVHWFALANPVYGSWERAVPRPKVEVLITD